MTLARDTTYNVLGAALPIAVSIVTVPLYIEAIGLERYGLLALCWLLVGYFNFFDFGIGRAIARSISKLEKSSAARRSDAFWTGATLSALLTLVALLASALAALVSTRYMTFGTAALYQEVYRSLPFLVFAVPISIIQSAFRGALEGRKQFFITNLVSTIGVIATAVLPLASTILWGAQLPVLIAVTVAVRLAVLVAMMSASAKAVPLSAYTPPDVERMKEMLGFGGWLTVSNLIGPILVFLDRFLIGALLGGSAVALYIIPFNLIGQLLLFPYALSAALFPRLAGPLDRNAESTHQLTIQTTLYFLTAASIVMIVAVGPFLVLWIGRSSAATSIPIAVVLVIGFWANALAQLPATRLQSVGRADLTAKVHAAECLPYILLLWLALKQFGVIGAAIAWSFRGVIDFLVLAKLDGVQSAFLRQWMWHGSIIAVLAILLLLPLGGEGTQLLVGALAGAASLTFVVATTPRFVIDKIWLAARNLARRA